MADNETTGTGKPVATDKVTYSGDADQNVQLIRSVHITGSEGSKTVVDITQSVGSAVPTGVLMVGGSDGTNARQLATNTSGNLVVVLSAETTKVIGTVNVASAQKIRLTDGTNDTSVSSTGALYVGGGIAHDGVDSGNPVKVGYKAIAHGTNPTAVAANDRTDGYANRHGIPWVIGGHPNVVTVKHTTITTAVTDAAIITVSAGTKIVVTRITCTLDNASTVNPTVIIGFGTANTPTTTGVLASHGGVPAGGGFTIGDGSGILGIGADNEDLRVTTTGNATGNGLQITVSYYTIDS